MGIQTKAFNGQYDGGHSEYSKGKSCQIRVLSSGLEVYSVGRLSWKEKELMFEVPYKRILSFETKRRFSFRRALSYLGFLIFFVTLTLLRGDWVSLTLYVVIVVVIVVWAERSYKSMIITYRDEAGVIQNPVFESALLGSKIEEIHKTVDRAREAYLNR
ncbi:MAG: hypothetical protein GTO54_04520 [Nitrososphaeria archaeon]|nr:hypothetical protein [Nitrososphaeria archaeon]NIN52243.1 hypothetical protein [Nitrososphaeria archaeon]